MDDFAGDGLGEFVDGDDETEEVDAEVDEEPDADWRVDGVADFDWEVDEVRVVGEFETVEVVKVLKAVPQSNTVIVEGGEEAEETVEELVEVNVASDLAALAV